MMKSCPVCAMAVVAALLPSSLSAGDADAFQSIPVSTTEADSGWDFSFSPYLWGASLGGEVGIGAVTTDVDLSFGDIFENLDIAAMGQFEARKGRWAFLVDGLWLKLESDGDTPGRLYGGAEVEVGELRFSGLISYRIAEGQTTVDLVGGASYFSLDTDIELLPGIAAGAKLSDSQDWVDPIVGVHIGHDFSEKWYSMLRAQIGGFGVGSELTWQIMAGVGYRINSCSSVVLGYRHLDIDYDDNDFVYDTETSGLMLGATFEF